MEKKKLTERRLMHCKRKYNKRNRAENKSRAVMINMDSGFTKIFLFIKSLFLFKNKFVLRHFFMFNIKLNKKNDI